VLRVVTKVFIFIAIFVIICCSCSGPNIVEPDNNPSDIDEVSFIATDPDGNLKRVTINDSLNSPAETLVVYRESGISFEWELEAVFVKSPWQAVSFKLDSPEKTADLEWDGSRISGSCWFQGSETKTIDQNISSASIHAWFVWAGFFGLPWGDEDWAIDFDMITSDLDVYGYRGSYDGEASVSSGSTGESIEAYRLNIDGRGLIGVFSPDIMLYICKAAPNIPVYCTVEGEGAVFRFYADSL